MGLTTSQREFIDSTLDHLLDFSNELQTFHLELTELKRALDPQDLTISETHDYYQLRQCLFNPTNYLQALEDQQANPITQGEVKHYIIELISTRLANKAKELNLTLTKELWDKDKLIANTKALTDGKQFASNIVPIDEGAHPWQLAELHNAIYSRSFRIDEPLEVDDVVINPAFVDVIINCGPYRIDATLLLENIIGDFDDDDDESSYLEDLKEDAEYEAEVYAARKVISYWAEKHPEDKIVYFPSLPTKIITNKFYFDLVEAGEIDYRLLLGLNANQEKNLIDPGIIDLLKAKVCDWDTAKNLSAASMRIATNPIYHALLKSNKIRINFIVNMTDSRSKFLICPPVANLIAQGKLTFLEAKRLPLTLKDIMTNSLYTNYFANPDINWQLFYKLTAEDCELIQNPLVGKLIVNKIIDITDLPLITAYVLELLESKSIYHLLENKYVSLNEIAKSTSNLLSCFAKDPQLVDWIKSGIIRLQDIDSLSKTALYISVYTNRLYHIYNEMPYIIGNVTDSIDMFIKELQIVADERGVDPTDLNEYILEDLMLMIKHEIQNKLLINKSALSNQYQTLVTVIAKAEQNNMTWKDMLVELISCATDVSRKLSTAKYLDENQTKKRKIAIENDTFFTTKRQKSENVTADNDLESLCRKIIKLSDINKMNQETQFTFNNH